MSQEDPSFDGARGDAERREDRHSPRPRPQLDPAPVEPYLGKPEPPQRAGSGAGRKIMVGLLAGVILACGLYMFLPARGAAPPALPAPPPMEAPTPPGSANLLTAPPQAASLEGMVQRESVEGSWTGRYYYPSNPQIQPPVHFSVVFAQTGNRFEGQISEPNTFGDDQAPFLQAGMSGVVSPGGRVNFTKTYDGTGRVGHSVEYSGVLSPDGRRISGTWTIPGVGTGSFELSR